MKISLAILCLLPTLGAAQNRPEGKSRPFQPPQVRLIEPGTGPLAVLRYTLNKPQDVTVVATGEMAVKRQDESKVYPFPKMTTPVTLMPGKDKVDFLWRKASFEAANGGGKQDSLIGNVVTALEGSQGELQTDARGVISQILLRAGPNDRASAGLIESRSVFAVEMGKGILSLLEIPLPEEPIGIGGRWQVERVAVRGALSLIQFTTFTLVKRTGHVLELTYRFGGKYDPGSAMKEEEVQLAVSGGGKCTLDLTLPMPGSLEDEIVINARMSTPDGQWSQQSTRVGTRIESK